MEDNTVLPDEGMTAEPKQDMPAEEETPPTEQVPAEGHSQEDEVTRLRRELEIMEQRYRSLAGVARSKDQQIEQMRALLEDLSKKVTAVEERNRPSVVENAVTPRDVEDLGEDVVSFVRRVVDTAVRSTTETFEARIKALEEKVNGVSQVANASAEQQFMATLDSKFPKWRQVNEDPDFITWLQASNARLEGFQTAAAAMDPEGVLVFFKAYAAEKGMLQDDASRADKKRKHVAPGKKKGATAAPAAGQNGEKIWTRAEISDFYAHGRKKYSPEEFARIEREIFKAQQEGRVQL